MPAIWDRIKNVFTDEIQPERAASQGDQTQDIRSTLAEEIETGRQSREQAQTTAQALQNTPEQAAYQAAEQRPPDIALASMDELRAYEANLQAQAQQMGIGDMRAYANLTDDIGIVSDAILARIQGLPVNETDRRVLLGLPTQEVLARVYGEAEETARETLLDRFQVRREGEAGYERAPNSEYLSQPAQAEADLRLYQEQNPGVSYQQLLKTYDEGMAFNADQPRFDNPAIQQGFASVEQQFIDQRPATKQEQDHSKAAAVSGYEFGF